MTALAPRLAQWAERPRCPLCRWVRRGVAGLLLSVEGGAAGQSAGGAAIRTAGDARGFAADLVVDGQLRLGWTPSYLTNPLVSAECVSGRIQAKPKTGDTSYNPSQMLDKWWSSALGDCYYFPSSTFLGTATVSGTLHRFNRCYMRVPRVQSAAYTTYTTDVGYWSYPSSTYTSFWTSTFKTTIDNNGRVWFPNETGFASSSLASPSPLINTGYGLSGGDWLPFASDAALDLSRFSALSWMDKVSFLDPNPHDLIFRLDTGASPPRVMSESPGFEYLEGTGLVPETYMQFRTVKLKYQFGADETVSFQIPAHLSGTDFNAWDCTANNGTLVATASPATGTQFKACEGHALFTDPPSLYWLGVYLG